MSCGIVGYGIYLPHYRIKLSDIPAAWDLPSGLTGEKTVPWYDEDAITMGVEAGQNALKHAEIDPAEIDALFFATVTNPYLIKQGSGIIASVLGVRNEAFVADITGSVSSCTKALVNCITMLESNKVNYGLVIASDMLVGEPGSDEELFLSSGAGALVLGKENLIAEIEGIYSYETEFTDTWQNVRDPYPRRTIERFIREHGYIKHIVEAGRGLLEELGIKAEDFNYAVFSQPNPRDPLRAMHALGFKEEQLSLGMICSLIGDTGSSSLFIALSRVLDKAKPKERILGISYGNGHSDALSIITLDKIEEKRQNIVEKYLERKIYVDYAHYLHLNRIIREG